MKRVLTFFLAMSIAVLFAVPSVTNAESESIPAWKVFTPKTEVEIDKEWTITFNDQMEERSLYQNISVIREKDNQEIFIEPVIDQNNKKAVKLRLGRLYDFNENYVLYIKDGVKSIKGRPLKEPVKMKFQTVNPEFEDPKVINQDGVEFQAIVSQIDKKLYTKIKVTNKSEETIPYFGKDGCDKGLSADLFTEMSNGKIIKGVKWESSALCTAVLKSYSLEAGETVEIIEVIDMPSEPLNGDAYLKINFQRGIPDGNDSLSIVKISVQLK
ncbi:Ig-like domain-containing protein [Metabacillus fastidiosus]|uniref:Ig-like domain-containing protein n=1 Tax=Metabacillus fastidiosus TaxID=1458 RepID=UPI002DB57385|nr:Ig-like domain-containing protein [Metabacillus fastidiosus]MEC2077503.1 Ig-like domain-containing protein [Metabacillus fastidiosus]